MQGPLKFIWSQAVGKVIYSHIVNLNGGQLFALFIYEVNSFGLMQIQQNTWICFCRKIVCAININKLLA